ncbi:electron transport complex protein RnfG [Marinospirillum celere]|uniref:Ion-translocating oxidoreductase complex subunit G n=1 Tax=Marinospirillum celere TaxID=1122252 RepID=A0A1I1EI52_9GAMM|nr:electron transport complex subunit RsxG [Marinospirillum celere]SFB84623.1 electron transport complex protein RnfG [Marinospirillum celere]
MSNQAPSLAYSLKRSVVGLVLFALVTAGAVSLTQVLTAERISHNRAEAAARLLFELAPPQEGYQLNIDQPLLLLAAPELGHSSPFAAHLAYQQEEPTLLLVPVIAPDGYTGKIELLVALHLDGHIQGVRVAHHLETPGLGDKIEVQKSNWIHNFVGRDLNNPEPEGWTVKKEGGEFDQFTGATITPRAVVRAVKRSLIWYQENQYQLTPQIERHAQDSLEDQ